MSDGDVNVWRDELMMYAQAAVGTPELAAGQNANPAYCAFLNREVRLQLRFMVLHQSYLALLSLATVLLLIGSLWRIWDGQAGVQQIVALAGAAVTGTAAAFITKNVKGAQKEYKAARSALQQANC
ncbi:hypothetical protein [Streptomyces lunaelactis]|uniref:hypothetical protein n=1 Tax=Streptomyces lunaelactis TaxID=1535768 RepID=UPI00131F4006|nr:hypothetical protein [Streptomyces lunaelactis]NUK89303.1 hypothetical protein [Streptomyces lunaelactis]